MKVQAMFRLLAERQVTDPPKQDQDKTWQQRMENGYKGKGRRAGSELPEGTFTQSPSEIAHRLKQHSRDFGEASSKLNGYINRKGRNLQGGDKSRLYDAKKALDNAYGNRDTNDKKTSAQAVQPLFTNDSGIPHDGPTLETGLEMLMEPK